MIRVELWRGDELLAEELCSAPPAALRAIDQHITDVHRRQHGEGTFRIEANRTDPAGQEFLSVYFHQQIEITAAHAA